MIEAALARHLRQQPRIRKLVDRHIYEGEIPAGITADTVMLLNRLGGEPYNDLEGEDDCTTSYISLDALGRGGGAAMRTFNAVNEARKALTREVFADYMGFGDQRHWVMMVTVIRPVQRIPTRPSAASDAWRHRFSIDFRITYGQGEN